MAKYLGVASLLAICLDLGLGAGLAQGAAAVSAKAPAAQAPATHGKTILLWPEGAPKAVGKSAEDTPTLTVYLPASNSTKTGVVVAPGGGYSHLSMQHEGEQIALWLNARGVAAFVLKYRLGPVYHHPV